MSRYILRVEFEAENIAEAVTTAANLPESFTPTALDQNIYELYSYDLYDGEPIDGEAKSHIHIDF